MEGNLSSANLMQGIGSFGCFDLQRSARVNQQQQPHPVALHHQHHSHTSNQRSVVPAIHDSFPPTIGITQDTEQNIPRADGEKCGSDDEEPSFMEDLGDGHNDLVKGKKASPWHRVKWTDTMVRLLITAVSYINEEVSAEYSSGGRRKYVNLQKKGKWKSVSKVMAERGHFVSPQQCEDKFNDLNKRYKRLNEILGRGTTCEVVENPTLLNVMDHIPEKLKEEVRKILSSKHLHYEEMCSYHNCNRLHLPADPELQQSLRMALRSRDDHDDNDVRRHLQDDNDDDDEHDADLENHDEYEENPALHIHRRVPGIFAGGPLKKMKQHHELDNKTAGNSLHTIDCNRTFDFQPCTAIADEQHLVEGTDVNPLQKQYITHHSSQLEEQKLHIQIETLHIQEQVLELERERFRWQRFSKKKDRELEMMHLDNERMKLENERMALELKRKEMGLKDS